MSESSFSSLVRYPLRKNELLQAWDAADEYLLDCIQELDLAHKRILIFNDTFGALASHLRRFEISVYTDSFVSARAIEINTQGQVRSFHNLNELKGNYDIVLIRVPKNLAFLEDQLAHLSQHLTHESLVFCGFMVKYFTPSIYELVEKYLGALDKGLAKKKARVIRTKFERVSVKSPYPTECRIDGFDLAFLHHSNLFSREKLDIGTRFLLDHMPSGSFAKILDLGCGNGVLGIKAKLLSPSSHLAFSDDSAMAILSAKENFKRYFPSTDDQATFFHTNCFEGGPMHCFDLVLCNPPFHQENTVGNFIALQMFNDAKKALLPGGVIRIVGNSHLGYQQDLKRLFGNCKIMATNKKFIILEARN